MFYRKKDLRFFGFEFEKDEFIKILNLDAKNCARNFSIVVQENQTVILFREGKRYNCRPGRIYPFLKDPEKKGSLLNKRIYRNVRIVCLAMNCIHCVRWGAAGIIMKNCEAQKSYQIGATGTLRFTIKDSVDAQNAFYGRFGIFGSNANERIKESIRDIVVHTFTSFLPGSELYASKLGQDLTAAEMHTLAESFYSGLEQSLSEFGIDVKTNLSDISSILSKERG